MSASRALVRLVVTSRINLNLQATPADQAGTSQSPTPTQVKSAGPVQTVVTAVTAVFRSIRNFFGF